MIAVAIVLASMIETETTTVRCDKRYDANGDKNINISTCDCNLKYDAKERDPKWLEIYYTTNWYYIEWHTTDPRMCRIDPQNSRSWQIGFKPNANYTKGDKLSEVRIDILESLGCFASCQIL